MFLLYTSKLEKQTHKTIWDKFTACETSGFFQAAVYLHLGTIKDYLPENKENMSRSKQHTQQQNHGDSLCPYLRVLIRISFFLLDAVHSYVW